MSMATLQLYKNPYMYPEYGNITAYGNSMLCTPVGVGLRTGTIRVKGDMADFMECNYLRIVRDGKTLYAWIEDVTTRTDNSFDVTYRVDAWRTYRNNVTLGTQFIARSSQVTYKRDKLLGSSRAYPVVTTTNNFFDLADLRVLVVQVRPGTGESLSSTPVQPSPYQFYVTSYPRNDWQSNTGILDLIRALEGGAETENIVTLYSIPYMDISSLPPQDLPVKRPGSTTLVGGFYLLDPGVNDPVSLLTREKTIDIGNINIDELMRVEHTVQIVVPDAGIINLPSELLKKSNLRLRQDIDIFSGTSNYMVVAGDDEYYGLSVRGSSTSSIPILSDPMDTYLSQNQNALATSLIGDVASIGVGTAMAVGTGGLGAAFGGGTIVSGLQGIVSTGASVLDRGAHYSNPPAFLGTATAGGFGSRFWVVVTQQHVDNASIVHSAFGYPVEKITNLSFPNSGGYVKTEGCAVTSDGSVPRWAIEEINQMFDRGVHVN